MALGRIDFRAPLREVIRASAEGVAARYHAWRRRGAAETTRGRKGMRCGGGGEETRTEGERDLRLRQLPTDV